MCAPAGMRATCMCVHTTATIANARNTTFDSRQAIQRTRALGSRARNSPSGVMCHASGRYPSTCSIRIETSTYENESPPNEANVSPAVERPDTEHLLVDDIDRVPWRRLVGGGSGGGGGGEDRLVVGFAARQARQLVELDDVDRAGRQRRQLGGHVSHAGGVGLGRHDQACVVAGAHRRHTVRRQLLFDASQIDAKTEQLGEPAAATDDLEQPVLVDAPEVAGDQFVDVGTAGEVAGPLGDPEAA